MAGRQRAGQQLSRNSHWIWVWGNTGLKGWGVQFTLSLEPSRTSIIREKALQFVLKGTENSRHLTNLTQTQQQPCLQQLHPLTATILPSAAPQLLWALGRGSLHPPWALVHSSSPLLPPGSWQLQIQKSPISRALVETDSSVSVTVTGN